MFILNKMAQAPGGGTLSGPDRRPAALVRRYGELYAQTRLEALDCLDRMPELVKHEDLKSKLLFSVIVVSISILYSVLFFYCGILAALLPLRGCHRIDEARASAASAAAPHRQPGPRPAGARRPGARAGPHRLPQAGHRHFRPHQEC